jgi:hypothetical protein
MRDHGYGLAFLLGVVSLVIAFLTGQLPWLVGGLILVLIGVVARPLRRIAIGRTTSVEWQRDAARGIHRRLMERLFEGTVTSTGSLTLQVLQPPEIEQPQTPDEFADTIVSQVVEPAIIQSATVVSPPEVAAGSPGDDRGG